MKFVCRSASSCNKLICTKKNTAKLRLVNGEKRADNKYVPSLVFLYPGPFNNDIDKAEYVSSGHGIKQTAQITCLFS